MVTNSSRYFEAPTAHGAGGKLKPGNKSDVSYPTWQVWKKPLGSGKHAVLAINLSEQRQTIAVSYLELGLQLRVRFQIIRNARIENVGTYQSCMVSKSRIIWKQTVAAGKSVRATDVWTGVEVTRGVGRTGLAFGGIGSHDSVFLVLELDEPALSS